MQVWCAKKKSSKFLIDSSGFPDPAFSGLERQGQPPTAN